MFATPLYMTKENWHTAIQIDEYNIVYVPTDEAPDNSWNEFRQIYANYFCDTSGTQIYGEFTDFDGNTFIVDVDGNIIKEGKLNKQIFVGNVDI